MLYVYTVVSDGFDNLRAPEVVSNSENVRYVCFTNIPNLPNVGPWQYRPIPDIGDVSRRNRVPKLLPHLMLPSDAEYSIYHDGNFQLKRLPEDLVKEFLGSHDWAAHRHPARDCVYREAEIIIRDCPLIPRDEVTAQVERYRKAEYPEHAGMWANGLLIRRHSRKVRIACEEWWIEFAKGCGRDQLSFPVIRRKQDLDVNTIDAEIYKTPLMNFYRHAAWKDREDKRFLAERKEIHMNLGHLNNLTGTKFQYPIYD